MEKVSVEKDVIRKSMELCNQAIKQYKQSSQVLERKYQEAGSTWRDMKYKQLGGVVHECTTALKTPIKELEECVMKLNKLLNSIERYESENI